METKGKTRLRTATPADADALARIYKPIVETTAISFEEVAPDADEMARRIAETLESYPYLVAERDGAILGFAYAGAHRPRAAYRFSADVTVYIDAPARGRGLGRTLYAELFRQLAAQGFHRAYAGIALPNPASVALHESCGFRHVGTFTEVGFKFGVWHDLGRWEKDLTA
jgi:phosphinothricin acetyltransferase